MTTQSSVGQLFERRITYPDFEVSERLDRLVGLEDHKARLIKIIGLLINSDSLATWVDTYHKGADSVLDLVPNRPPLVILEGDVGTGKTELAETIGDAVARKEDVNITLFPLSLSTRGQGRVGEMTQLLSAAFDHTFTEARKLKNSQRISRGAVILLVDEADAITQSRDTTQMHHEDRAGVNAFIRGVDRLGNGKLPVAVIMCTNRFGALDPAVTRRAADILTFTRPDKKQRFAVVEPPLKQLGLSSPQIKEIVNSTGPNGLKEYGFTFSDIRQRLLPSIILDAYPDNPVNPDRALEIARNMRPTPPFQDNGL